MGVDILASNIGYKSLEAILLPLEDDAGLRAMRRPTIFLGAEKDAQLQRHIEARKRRIAVRLCSGDIMNAIAAFLYDLADFVEPVVGRIVCFKRTTRYKPRTDNRENDRIEKFAIFIVKGTIGEDVAVGSSYHAD